MGVVNSYPGDPVWGDGIPQDTLTTIKGHPALHFSNVMVLISDQIASHQIWPISSLDLPENLDSGPINLL